MVCSPPVMGFVIPTLQYCFSIAKDICEFIGRRIRFVTKIRSKMVRWTLEVRPRASKSAVCPIYERLQVFWEILQGLFLDPVGICKIRSIPTRFFETLGDYHN